ncbi:MAG: hypothetical protein J6C61_02500 [Clostridia bacterium]|nr:hypothetical protein [Clostridia bacterium]
MKISQLGREDEEKGAEVDEVRYSKTGSNGEFSKADLETIKQSISDVVDVAVSNKGKINEKYNQKQLSEVPDSLSQMIALATDGEIDISKKIVAIHGDYLWHEFDRHTKESDEQARHQIAFTKEQFKEAIVAIYSPDMVECVFATSDNPTQQRSFAYAKKSDNGYYVAVEVVGGKRNPNIVPIMILQFDEIKWKNMIDSGKTLGELFYENDEELKNVLDIDFNKKNRVTAAQFASSEAIANTLRSPRSNNIISENGEKINTFDKKIDDERKSISKSADVTQSKQFIRFFGDWQNNPQDASKVVNADGTPRVVYHGSNQEFSVFDLQMSGKNFGEASQGFFFFTNKKVHIQIVPLIMLKMLLKKRENLRYTSVI